MAQEQLKAATGSGSQTTTQSPQTAGSSSASTATASGVQPGTATSLLNSTHGGVALKNTPLSVVGLGQRTESQTSQVAAPLPKHQVNPVMFGFSVLLFMVAVAMFWATARSAKNTT